MSCDPAVALRSMVARRYARALAQAVEDKARTSILNKSQLILDENQLDEKAAEEATKERQVAEGGGILEDILKELEMVLKTIRETPLLREIMQHPEIPREEKGEILSLCFKERVSQIVMNLVRILADEGRIGELEDIVAEYRRLLDEKLGIIQVTVKAWGALTPEEQQELAQALSSLTKMRVRLHVTEDKSILGGIVVYINSRVIDGSVAGLFARLKEAMRSALVSNGHAPMGRNR